ncbi:MAG: hypothetical protein AB7P21_13860 [Lautropia sp.]
MVFDIPTAMLWLLFLALFPMAFIWLRRAWRILVNRDYSEVALKGGEPPPEPKRFALVEALFNIAAGAAAVFVIVGVLGFGMHFDTWTAIAGSTIWCKIFANFALSRHAHAKLGRART